MSDEEWGREADTVCSPHLMLHLTETQNKPVPSAAPLTDTQSLWSRMRRGKRKSAAQNRQCAFSSLTVFVSQLLRWFVISRRNNSDWNPDNRTQHMTFHPSDDKDGEAFQREAEQHYRWFSVIWMKKEYLISRHLENKPRRSNVTQHCNSRLCRLHRKPC